MSVRRFVTDAAAQEMRLDANETLALERDLVAVEAKIYETKYAPTAARTIIPTGGGVPAREGPYAWRRVTHVTGETGVVGLDTDSPPFADAYGEETPGNVKGIPQAFRIGLSDELVGQTSRVDVYTERAKAARYAIEQAIDSYAMQGSTVHGWTGFANAAGVNATTMPNTDWDNAARTADQIIEDITACFATVFAQSHGTFTPNAVALPTEAWMYLKKPRSDVSDTTIMQFLSDAFPGVQWYHHWRLNKGQIGTNGRMIVWQRDAEVCDLVVPREFTMLPAQQRLYESIVPCYALFGGCRVRYPVAMTYADNVMS